MDPEERANRALNRAPNRARRAPPGRAWIAVLLAAALPLGQGASRAMTPRAIASAAAATIRMRPGESLPAALRRAGLTAAEASEASGALADVADVVNPHPGLALDLVLTATPDAAGRRLRSLTLAPRDDERVLLSRDRAGRLRARRISTAVYSAPRLVRGVVRGSLYLSVVEAGADGAAAARLTEAFGRRLDLARDIESGDPLRLIFDQSQDAAGEPLGPPRLIFAEVVTRAGDRRLYGDRPGERGEDRWVDAEGDDGAGSLLRTPVDGARVTSGFGERLHPLLGFTRMHQGVDFGAPTGSAVLAAADGVVEETRWLGDYGRWLRIRHAPGLETGYGHLSAWAPGVGPGARVRQGQVVAYVGATGLATGPHLHFEVFADGRRIDPRAAPALGGARPWGGRPGADPEFRARRAAIDATVAALTSPAG